MIKINKKKAIAIVFLAAILFLSLPYLKLFKNPYLLSHESYYHLRIMETIDERGFIFNDELIVGERPYNLNLAHYLFFKIFPEIIVRILPFLLGIATVYLFYRILESLKVKQNLRLIIILLFASSPVFIYTFATFNSCFIPVFLLTLAFFSLLKNKFSYSIVLLCLMPLFNIKMVPIVLAFLIIYFVSSKKLKYLSISGGSLIAVSLIYYALVFSFKFPERLSFIDVSILKNISSDFGSFYGFSAFFLILALIGSYILWAKKKEYLALYIATTILFFSSLYFVFINIFLNFFFAFFAAIGITSLMKRRWEYKTIKNATLLLILCGLLFSTSSFINRTIDSEPTNAQIRSLEYLALFPDQGSVLSHYKNGFLIEYFTKKQVVMDENLDFSQGLTERYNDTLTIFYSRDLEHTKNLLNKYDVGYICIDGKMKSGLVWDKKDQGLLFLFRNEETFKNIYSYQELEVWKYLK